MAIIKIDFITNTIKGKAPLLVTFTPIIENNVILDVNVDFINLNTGEDFVENNNTNDFIDF